VIAMTRMPVVAVAFATAVFACFAPARLSLAASKLAEHINTDCEAVSAAHQYLSSDDRMKLATGTWGRSVHSEGPGFLRFEHESQHQKDAVLKCLKG
jgi:hypothetical protein